MLNKSLMRQVALVSYGTQYLRDEILLDDWYRHGVFFEARIQFRSLGDNTLLADDFTWWLGILKLSGATRLTLHLAKQFEIGLPHPFNGDEFAVVVHYPDRYQIWAIGKEQAQWRNHRLIKTEEAVTFPRFPDAAYYGGDLDGYWCTGDRLGSLQVPDTNWKKLGQDIATDLKIDFPNSVSSGPYIVRAEPDWAKLPLFPFGSAATAHRILATLDKEAAQFSNDMNPKNENSIRRNTEEFAAQWGERLESWIVEVALRCANHVTRLSSLEMASDERVYTVAPVQPATSEHEEINVDPSFQNDAATSRNPASESKWGRYLGTLFATAVWSLFVLALANIIVAWPWLAVFIGLPLFLGIKWRKDL